MGQIVLIYRIFLLYPVDHGLPQVFVLQHVVHSRRLVDRLTKGPTIPCKCHIGVLIRVIPSHIDHVSHLLVLLDWDLH